MIKRIHEASPRLKARIAGVFYLLAVFTAVFAEAFIRGKLLYAAGLIPVLCFSIVTLLMCSILGPVSRTVALVAACSNLVGLAFEALELHLGHVNAALVFHGVYCVLIGYLVLRSSFLPRIMGILMALGGLGWLVPLSPSLVHFLHSYNVALGFFGEGSLMLWLLVMGVKAQKWRAD
jgi:hypothetical protein